MPDDLNSPDTNLSPIEIDCRTVCDKLATGADLFMLDCREPAEHELVRLASATLLPMGEIPARIAELQQHRDREIVVFCHLGMRSLEVAKWLREQGFANAKSMAGGIEQWARDIDPTLPRY